jgi:hypothetical protein
MCLQLAIDVRSEQKAYTDFTVYWISEYGVSVSIAWKQRLVISAASKCRRCKDSRKNILLQRRHLEQSFFSKCSKKSFLWIISGHLDLSIFLDEKKLS